MFVCWSIFWSCFNRTWKTLIWFIKIKHLKSRMYLNKANTFPKARLGTFEYSIPTGVSTVIFVDRKIILVPKPRNNSKMKQRDYQRKWSTNDDGNDRKVCCILGKYHDSVYFWICTKTCKENRIFYEFADFDICVARPHIRLFAVCRIRVNYGNAD